MTDQATLARNKEIGRQVLEEMWGAGRLDLADRVYAAEYVDHVGKGPEAGTVVGPAGIKAAVSMFRTAFPDLTYVVDFIVAEGDLVAARFSARGTHRGPFRGVAPTGRSVTYTGIDINRIRGGRIVESWVNYDALALLQQLGIVPAVEGM